jgi:hypothetical protein
VLFACYFLAGFLRSAVHEEEPWYRCDLDCFVHDDEYLHVATSQQGGKRQLDVGCIGRHKIPTLTSCSMVGGGLMFAVGALYLVFERNILADANTRSGSSNTTSLNSRLILSVQVSS